MSEDLTKKCNRCSKVKSLGMFNRQLLAKDGVQAYCRSCTTELSTIRRRSMGIAPQEEVYGLFKEYGLYKQMKQRCYNPKSSGYIHYGGRGILVCPRWLYSFDNFYDDMGPKPDNMSLDRVDVHGNYEKGNCRWASPKEQARNTRRNRIIEYDGAVMCVAEWAEYMGVKQNTMLYRLRRGWPIVDVVNGRTKKRK